MANLIAANYGYGTDQILDQNFRSNPQPSIIKFPGFKRSLLASLVLTSTASRTSDIVTVTATAHGIPTGATYVGYRFFYPGSPSLAAGWYDSIVSIPDANTLTFNAPGADFGSESINGGAIYTTLTDVASVVIPANLIAADVNISAIGYRGGDTSSNAKSLRTYLNGLNVHTDSVTTTSFVRFMASAVLADIGTGKAFGHGGFDNLSSITEYSQNVPLGADTIFSVKVSLAAAGGYIYIPTIKVLVQ